MAIDPFSPWIWGLAGAFLYAAPKLILCMSRDSETGWKNCIATFCVAMIAGPVLAESFGPWLGYRFEWMIEPDGRALFVTIGLTGNPTAPLLIRLVRGHISRYAAVKDDLA